MIESDIKTRANKNWYLVLEIEKVLQERFPYGAFNRIDVVQNQEISDEERKAYTATWSKIIDEISVPEKLSISKMADISQTLLLADCGLFTSYAIGYIKNKYPEVNIEFVSLDVHAMLVIGRDTSSEPDDIKTWGKEAILFDYWANKSYLASDFHEIQAKTPDIPFYAGMIDLSTYFTGLDVTDKHYLKGNPVALPRRGFKILAEWVKEDQRRLTLPQPSSLKSPLYVTSPLDSDAIETLLTQLSKCGGWKFNKNNSSAILECTSQKQSERIKKTLETTKAVVVTLGSRKDNQVPTVKCEQFDFTQLQKIASSFSVNDLEGIDLEFWGVNTPAKKII
ncbi:MAG: hypothetical protein WC627_10420 [Legionella sp.]|jgi:hypothetical protein